MISRISERIAENVNSGFRTMGEQARRFTEAISGATQASVVSAQVSLREVERQLGRHNRRMSAVRYRNRLGQFAVAPSWWRPRDEYGRFADRRAFRLPTRPPLRDRFGRFLPRDGYLREHILSHQHELLAEGCTSAEVRALSSPDRWARYVERLTVEPRYRWLNEPLYEPFYTTNQAWVDISVTTTIAPVHNVQVATNETLWDLGTTANNNYYATYTAPVTPTSNHYYSNNINGPITSIIGLTSAGPIPASPAEVRLRARITDAEFDDHPDPDALLGQTFDDLKMRLAQEITERYGMSTDEVWREWTFDATTRYEPAPTDVERADSGAGRAWDAWVIEMRAVNEQRIVTDGQESVVGGVWHDWAGATWHDIDAPRYRNRRPPRVPRQPTVEELRQQAADERRGRTIHENRQRAQALRKRIAERKAKELLMSCLDDEQRADLERANGFRVATPSGRLYWVAKGYMGNVYLIDEQGNRVSSFCIHGPSHLPDEDQMLAQKLLLETDEPSFLRIANRSIASGRVDLQGELRLSAAA